MGLNWEPMLFLLDTWAPIRVDPPAIRREFRAAWVATVDNIDWPSQRTLSTDEQKRELRLIMETAAGMHLNAIILQVRPSADALYPSKLEPWSEYLTGGQGKPPAPYYDPLAYAVQQAHAHGLELHCWLNPYRAFHPAQKGPLSKSSIARTHPEVVRKYGPYLWMDPGSPLVQKRTLDVVRDLVRRYDIDGIHIDDYFYPYPEGKEDFPDQSTYKAYESRGGRLARADWRRRNVDTMIHSMYDTIKRAKPWVQFGISPFGIYRPGVPEGIHSGIDQYAELYADAKKWLNEGWCDYFTPQLYWSVNSKGQNYGKLLDWWISENRMGRHVWPGNFTSRTDPKSSNWSPNEIEAEIEQTRKAEDGAGNVHFSMIAFLKNFNGVADALRGGLYSDPVLPPTSSWLGDRSPERPDLKKDGVSAFRWRARGKHGAMWFAVWVRYGSTWQTFVLPSGQTWMQFEPELPKGRLNCVAVAAVDRLGNMSPVAAIGEGGSDGKNEAKDEGG